MLNYTKEEIINRTKDLSMRYCLLRYKQEQELRHYKESFDYEIKDYIQEIFENGISKKNIDYHRHAYEKLANTCDYSNPNLPVKTPQEIAEFVFSTLIRTVEENKSNTMFAYKEQYFKAYDYIISYYKKYFEIKDAIAEFKEIQSKELSKVVQEIKEEGTPIYIVKYIYNRFKTDVKALKQGNSEELQMCNTVYEQMRADLFKFKEQIDDIDSKDKIDCEITREEAIERIEFIKELIDDENYETLREEWNKSEHKLFGVDIKDRISKVLNDYNYCLKNFKNLKNFNNLTECSNEYLLKIIELPGIRLSKRHKYTIV